MNQRHAHPASNGRKQNQAPAKTARPNPHRRVHSYHNVHSQPPSGNRTLVAAAKKASREAPRAEDADEGMAGLPQFCTTCERQIVNPGHSTLYCSRACQRRDSSKSAPIEPVVSPAFTPAPSYFDVPQPDILPQRSPTVLRPLSLTLSDLGMSDPGSPSDTDSDRRRSQRLSDATRYYGHYAPDDYPVFSTSLSRRPPVNRASTSTLPSLSHTPSSSVGTVASFTSSRPFPPRHDPLGGHRSEKSADLVIPIFAGPGPGTAGTGGGSAAASAKSSASTLTSFHAAEAADVSYARRDWAREGPAHGSLRQLFGHEAMASTPKGRTSGWE